MLVKKILRRIVAYLFFRNYVLAYVKFNKKANDWEGHVHGYMLDDDAKEKLRDFLNNAISCSKYIE